jgi:hypothetical protein
LIYERCDGCERESCLQCRREDRVLTLRVVEADETPSNSLNGPSATPEEITQRMGKLFAVDEDGKIYFTVKASG